MSLNVRYVDVPLGAQEDAVAFADTAQPFGTAQQLVTGSPDTPWASLEPGSWALDGTRKLLPDEPIEIGWWSEKRTGDDGRFDEPPTISISFPLPYTATGITFHFWQSLQQWCGELNVTWYNGEDVLAQVAAYPDEAHWILQKAVEGFDRIEIQLLATNMPGQFAKISQIQIGQVVMFLQDEIVQVNLLNEVDPSLCELSVDTMTVEIRDRKNRTLIPQQNQAMHLFRNGEQIASHYITDSSRESQQYYTFQCQSAIGRLEDDYLGGIYNGYPLETLLAEVVGSFSYALDAQLSGETVTGYLPVCTRREALQQIAFAVGSVVTTQGDGTIRFSPLKEDVEATFDGGNIFTGAKVSREAQTAAVQIFVHRYTPGTEVDTLLDGEEVMGSSVLYVFSEPHHSYTISGGTIESSGENWVRINATEKVTLTGKKYLHSTSIRKKENKMATAAEKGNVVTVEDATLIHAGNADAALERLYSFNTLKNLLTQQAVISDQRTGQITRSINPWGKNTVGYIVRMENAFTNSGHTADVTIRGKEESEE